VFAECLQNGLTALDDPPGCPTGLRASSQRREAVARGPRPSHRAVSDDNSPSLRRHSLRIRARFRGAGIENTSFSPVSAPTRASSGQPHERRRRSCRCGRETPPSPRQRSAPRDGPIPHTFRIAFQTSPVSPKTRCPRQLGRCCFPPSPADFDPSRVGARQSVRRPHDGERPSSARPSCRRPTSAIAAMYSTDGNSRPKAPSELLRHLQRSAGRRACGFPAGPAKAGPCRETSSRRRRCFSAGASRQDQFRAPGWLPTPAGAVTGQGPRRGCPVPSFVSAERTTKTRSGAKRPQPAPEVDRLGIVGIGIGVAFSADSRREQVRHPGPSMVEAGDGPRR